MDFDVKNYRGDRQARNAIELSDFGSIQLMHTISGNELYIVIKIIYNIINQDKQKFLDILDKVWKHVIFSERAINENGANFAINAEKKSLIFIDFKTKQSNVLNRDELVSMKMYVSPTAFNDGDAADVLRIYNITTIRWCFSSILTFSR
ncbi:MAG: hypothetical protein EZS28_039462 [Streblomastix strix]|uniref:Uncharacterized protein n=1 Tax=Streblomastix strix TaxID=222440 RepID=A0A5J4U4T6_9EUKA|nr:MAG: hypothetical protein EZS28_039462 [Streblomastix strix]